MNCKRMAREKLMFTKSKRMNRISILSITSIEMCGVFQFKVCKISMVNYSALNLWRFQYAHIHTHTMYIRRVCVPKWNNKKKTTMMMWENQTNGNRAKNQYGRHTFSWSECFVERLKLDWIIIDCRRCRRRCCCSTHTTK